MNEFTGPLPFFIFFLVKGEDNSKGGSEKEEELSHNTRAARTPEHSREHRGLHTCDGESGRRIKEEETDDAQRREPIEEGKIKPKVARYPLDRKPTCKIMVQGEE